MKSTFNLIPDGTPNKDFYADKVCTCNNYGPDHFPNDVGFFEYHKLLSEGKPQYEIMKCGKYEAQNSLSICSGCDSVFYTLFCHPNQHDIDYNSRYWPTTNGQFCWHCLEAGLNKSVPSWRYRSYPLVPPISELLNPYVKPRSMSEKLNSLNNDIDSFSTSLDDILAELNLLT